MDPDERYERFIEDEDRMAREADAERRRELDEELAEIGFDGTHSCPSGTMYVHKPGVFCPACGATP